MAVTAPPATPNRALSQPIFSQQVYDFLNWFQTAVPEFNALAVGSTTTGTFNTITLNNYLYNSTAGTALLPSDTWTGDTNTGRWHPAADTEAWSNNGVETFRTGANNAIRIGQTTTDAPGVANTTVGVAIMATGNTRISATASQGLTLNRNTSDGAIQGFYREGLAVGTISVTTTNTAYNTASDHRLKEVLPGMEGFLPSEMIAQLAAAQDWYLWKADREKVELGWLAHKLAEVAPFAVTGEKDAVDDDGTMIPQQRDDSKLIPVLVAALADAQRRIEALELTVDQFVDGE